MLCFSDTVSIHWLILWPFDNIYHKEHFYAQTNTNFTGSLLSKIIELMKQNCVLQVPPTRFIYPLLKCTFVLFLSPSNEKGQTDHKGKAVFKQSPCKTRKSQTLLDQREPQLNKLNKLV